MKTIELLDHELPVADFSNFELRLHGKAGKCTASYRQWTTPQGVAYVGLTNPVIDFDETQTPEGEVEQLLQLHGFQRKPTS